MCRAPSKIYLLWCRLWFYDCLRSSTEIVDRLWKEILSQQRMRHFKILQSIYFAYDVGIISSYSNRNWRLSYILLWNKWQCSLFLELMALSCSSEVLFVKFPRFLAFFVGLFFGNIHFHAGPPVLQCLAVLRCCERFVWKIEHQESTVLSFSFFSCNHRRSQGAMEPFPLNF